MTSPAAAAVENGLPLQELDRDTAKVGKWYFRVCHVQIITYEYQLKGKSEEGCKFQCVMISPDSSMYALAVYRMRSKNKKEVEAQLAKFKDGTTWKLTKVAFLDEKAQYISSPIQEGGRLVNYDGCAGAASVSAPQRMACAARKHC